MPLEPKQARFVSEYCKSLNATEAAIKAGYSPNGARQTGSRLLANKAISEAVAEKTQKKLDATDLTAARVIQEIARLALHDPAKVYNDDGSLKKLSEIDPDTRAALHSPETLIRNLNAADGVQDTVVRWRTWDKTKALDLLAKHFGLLTEKVEHSGGVVFKWQGSDE